MQDYVYEFRRALAQRAKIEPLLIFTEDHFASFVLNYDDDMAMFLTQHDLLNNPSWEYSYPLEEVANIGELVVKTLELNAAS